MNPRVFVSGVYSCTLYLDAVTFRPAHTTARRTSKPPNPGHHSRSWFGGGRRICVWELQRRGFPCGMCMDDATRARARAITLFDKTRLLGRQLRCSGSACFGFLLFLCFIVVGRSAERRPIADRASAADKNYNAERATALTRNDADAHPQDVVCARVNARSAGGACVSWSDSLGQRRRSHGIVFTFHSTVR